MTTTHNAAYLTTMIGAFETGELRRAEFPLLVKAAQEVLKEFSAMQHLARTSGIPCQPMA
jgi:hypothetical protein